MHPLHHTEFTVPHLEEGSSLTGEARPYFSVRCCNPGSGEARQGPEYNSYRRRARTRDLFRFMKRGIQSFMDNSVVRVLLETRVWGDAAFQLSDRAESLG